MEMAHSAHMIYYVYCICHRFPAQSMGMQWKRHMCDCRTDSWVQEIGQVHRINGFKKNLSGLLVLVKKHPASWGELLGYNIWWPTEVSFVCFPTWKKMYLVGENVFETTLMKRKLQMSNAAASHCPGPLRQMISLLRLVEPHWLHIWCWVQLKLWFWPPKHTEAWTSFTFSFTCFYLPVTIFW